MQRAKKTANNQDLAAWLRAIGATESVKYDADTGEPHVCFTLDLTKAETNKDQR